MTSSTEKILVPLSVKEIQELLFYAQVGAQYLELAGDSPLFSAIKELKIKVRKEEGDYEF